MKYLSLDGVKYLWSKIKSIFIKKSDALSYEEIQASTDLTGKVASGEAMQLLIKKAYMRTANYPTGSSSGRTIVVKHSRNIDRISLLAYGDGNGYPWIGVLWAQVGRTEHYAYLYSLRDQANFKSLTINTDTETGVSTIYIPTQHAWETISFLGCADIKEITVI